MNDPCLELLLQQLPLHIGKKLWLADEHHDKTLQALPPYKTEILVLSNRFDISEKAKQLELDTLFNDWDLSTHNTMKAVFLRVCKEKPVTNHLIQLAFNALEQGGTLVLIGQKNEGIKSYEKTAGLVFYGTEKDKRLKKVGSSYIGHYTKQPPAPPQSSDYAKLTEIGQWKGKTLYSKHGVYGWNKIDKGSATLIEHLDQIITNHAQSTESILDLGCGYGFLSIASSHIPCLRRVATDNNAGALICASHNAKLNEVSLEVIAGDCGDTVEGRFDLILCNPPFHKGFDVDGDLTKHFLLSSRNKLKTKGIAVFVVNSFIPIEKKLTQFFSSAKLIVNTGQFKVLVLTP